LAMVSLRIGSPRPGIDASILVVLSYGADEVKILSFQWDRPV